MLLTLINDLLDLAKQQQLTFELRSSYFSLIDTINRAFTTLSFLASSKNIECVLDVSDVQVEVF